MLAMTSPFNTSTSSPLSRLRAVVRLVGRFQDHVRAFLMDSDTRQHVAFRRHLVLRAVLVRQGNCAKSDPNQLRLIEEPTDPPISSIGHLLDTITLPANNVLIFKRPRRDSNPCYRRERAMSLLGSGRCARAGTRGHPNRGGSRKENWAQCVEPRASNDASGPPCPSQVRHTNQECWHGMDVVRRRPAFGVQPP